jgi:acetyltransferase-like isoleucine patch superfamily enzyme
MTHRLQLLRQRAFRFWAGRRVGAQRLRSLGRGSVIVPPATILSPHRIEIGDHVLVHEHAHFSVVEEYRGRDHQPRLRIGDGTIIGHRVWFSCVGEIDVGERVLVGHDVLIADSFHEYRDRDRPIIDQPMARPRRVSIGSGVAVGPGAAILSGASIGEGAYVAANAVVVGQVPAHSVVAGNPAEVIRRWDPEREEWVDSADRRWAGLLAALTRD